jgi:hypothetical protein
VGLTEGLENMNNIELTQSEVRAIVLVQTVTRAVQLFVVCDCPFLFSFNPGVIMSDR